MPAPDKDTYCLVQNGGTGVDANAGGFTAAALAAQSGDVTKFVGSNGEPKGGYWAGDQTALTVLESLANKVILQGAGDFADVVNGSIAFVMFSWDHAGSDDYADGYYECNKLTSDQIELVDLTYNPLCNTHADALVGGAFPSLGSVANTDLMNAATYNRTCLVRGDATVAATITVNTGGGASYQIMKRFIACNSSWVAAEGAVTYTAGATLTTMFDFTATSYAFSYWEGFVFDGDDRTTQTIKGDDDSCNSHNLVGCTFRKALYGVTHRGRDWTVIRCLVHHCTTGGIATSPGTSRGARIFIYDTVFHSCDVAWNMREAPQHIVNCLIYDCTTGVQWFSALGSTIRGLTIDGCTTGIGTPHPSSALRLISKCIITNCTVGVDFSGYDTPLMDSILFYNNGDDLANPSTAYTTNRIDADPLYMDRAGKDFRLQHNSPAIADKIGWGHHPPDYPAIGDVKSGVDYANAELTGTYVGSGSGGGGSGRFAGRY